MSDINNKNRSNDTLFSENDVRLFKSGDYFGLYEKLGSHTIKHNGILGTHFAVWAPGARAVSVMGDFNDWDSRSDLMQAGAEASGVWEIFIPGVKKGNLYKFNIKPLSSKDNIIKSDPFAFYCELSPKTASVVWDLEYAWGDSTWMKNRKEKNSLEQPFSIYEIHAGSWRRDKEQNDRQFNYRELADVLVEYIKETGFTHIELLPIMEHPFYGSWGYQVTGYFAPTSRYGTPQDLMYLVDIMHQNNIGVILDWVPSHFPDDPHGLSRFDGTYLYEYEDPKQGFHPDWKSLIFNYNRNEVSGFLINSALFWLDKYHIDGIRVDAVASMLYLDYSRKEGQWIPNRYGGNENLEAIRFIKKLNETIYARFPDVQAIAEESTAWPAVTRPTNLGGLGFGMKWNMGWMHDTLEYFKKDPVHRKFHQKDLFFSFHYAFSENFVLPISHDEVVYGKKSLLEKMPGDKWQKFANMRTLLSYMFCFPGKKLIFMGIEFAQLGEWDHDGSLAWSLLGSRKHEGVFEMVCDLNRLYRGEVALHSNDFKYENFELLDSGDGDQGILSFLRKSNSSVVLAVCNFTPVPRTSYRISLPVGGIYIEIFNSDSENYGGSGYGNSGNIETKNTGLHEKSFFISVNLPPLAMILLKKS